MHSESRFHRQRLIHFVRHYMKYLLFFQTSDRGWPACGRPGRQTSARTKTSARLKINFVDMTYPKGWTGSLPLCPLIFSCLYSIHARKVSEIKTLSTLLTYTCTKRFSNLVSSSHCRHTARYREGLPWCICRVPYMHSCSHIG